MVAQQLATAVADLESRLQKDEALFRIRQVNTTAIVFVHDHEVAIVLGSLLVALEQNQSRRPSSEG